MIKQNTDKSTNNPTHANNHMHYVYNMQSTANTLNHEHQSANKYDNYYRDTTEREKDVVINKNKGKPQQIQQVSRRKKYDLNYLEDSHFQLEKRDNTHKYTQDNTHKYTQDNTHKYTQDNRNIERGRDRHRDRDRDRHRQKSQYGQRRYTIDRTQVTKPQEQLQYQRHRYIQEYEFGARKSFNIQPQKTYIEKKQQKGAQDVPYISKQVLNRYGSHRNSLLYHPQQNYQNSLNHLNEIKQRSSSNLNTINKDLVQNTLIIPQQRRLIERPLQNNAHAHTDGKLNNVIKQILVNQKKLEEQIKMLKSQKYTNNLSYNQYEKGEAGSTPCYAKEVTNHDKKEPDISIKDIVVNEVKNDPVQNPTVKKNTKYNSERVLKFLKQATKSESQAFQAAPFIQPIVDNDEEQIWRKPATQPLQSHLVVTDKLKQKYWQQFSQALKQKSQDRTFLQIDHKNKKYESDQIINTNELQKRLRQEAITKIYNQSNKYLYK